MILSEVVDLVERDLFDTSNTRWAVADIERSIDKAVNRLSDYYPQISFADMAAQPYQRIYPYPASWNASYPVLWIERVLYPLQVKDTRFDAPSAPSAAAAAGAGMGSGTYKYLITFLTQGGETTAGAQATVVTSGGNQQVSLSNIPVGTSSSPSQSSNYVIGRNIYRTAVGGSTFLYLATIGDNSTTSYTDAAADATLTGKPQPPTVNTSGLMIYPPRERDFAEYSNLFSGKGALAAGGNMGSMGAVGIDPDGISSAGAPSFTLLMSDSDLPTDNSLVMRVFYATKHQLDSSGSTIPEIHKDIIVLGAVAYALEAYQVPTNDNFMFRDGSLHDMVDDTKIPSSWIKTAQEKMKQFTERLEQIKRQRSFSGSARAAWGEVPYRWHRL